MISDSCFASVYITCGLAQQPPRSGPREIFEFGGSRRRNTIEHGSPNETVTFRVATAYVHAFSLRRFCIALECESGDIFYKYFFVLRNIVAGRDRPSRPLVVVVYHSTSFLVELHADAVQAVLNYQFARASLPSARDAAFFYPIGNGFHLARSTKSVLAYLFSVGATRCNSEYFHSLPSVQPKRTMPARKPRTDCPRSRTHRRCRQFIMQPRLGRDCLRGA